ncbi:MAG: FtsX-like permease family protein, partial [Bacteroidales bacterium]|nr:FtsX-like permease family protein [Bacteroidales bacterium]
PFTIVITEKIAKKYFGDSNPMGEMMNTGSGNSYKVTAVIENMPLNSHLSYDALISSATTAHEAGVEEFNSMEPVRFWNIGVYTYILLHEKSSMQSIYDKFPAFYEKYMKEIGDTFNASFNLLSTPLCDTHFSSELGADRPSGNMSYVNIFMAIALFIILIAAINYMNMATARSARRAREVGMRKVVGANRSQLIRQFLSESILMSFLAMVIAVILVYVLLPDFNTLSGKSLSFGLLSQPETLIVLCGIAIIVGILSGSYPAFYLSSFQPVYAIKGSTARGSGRSTKGKLRRSLVVIQFFIAIVLIIATIVVKSQLDYMKNKDLGFRKENVVVLELQDSAFRSKVEPFKDELLKNPNVIGVTNSTGVPGRINWLQVMYVEGEEGMKENALILAQTDYDFIDVMGMEIMQGRNFDKSMGTDKEEAVIINEAGVKELGWVDNPIGKKIHYGFDIDGTGGNMLKVIGVVKDFNFTSLHNRIEPVILFISEVPRFLLSIRIKEENRRATLDFIEEKWNDIGAKRPFYYVFLDQSLDEMYQAEEKLGVIFRIATILTIFIALLGLLGLSSFIVEQRTKEIGIRKILGASTGHVVWLLFKEFITLIILAFILAVPFSWWRLDIWINDTFIYHDTIKWASFAIAGTLALAIGVITISFHVIRVASANPVNSIKYE